MIKGAEMNKRFKLLYKIIMHKMVKDLISLDTKYRNRKRSVLNEINNLDITIRDFLK